MAKRAFDQFDPRRLNERQRQERDWEMELAIEVVTYFASYLPNPRPDLRIRLGVVGNSASGSP